MRSKILSLALILMLVSTMFVLTGCGEEEKSSSSKKSSSSSYAEKDDDEEEEVSKDVQEIFDVVETYTGGIAAVQLKETDEDGEIEYVTYIADETGELIDKVGTSDYTVQNGCYIYKPGEMNYSYILSYNTDERIYPAKSNIAYYCISENGYALIERKEEALAGDTYYFEIIDQNWNVIYSMEDYKDFNDDIGKWNSYWCGWYFDDIFYITCNSTVTLIDASTGKTIECGEGYLGKPNSTEVTANGKYLGIGDTVITSGLEVLEGVTTDNILNDKYYVDGEKIYSIKTGEVAYDFEEGGLDTIYYYDGIYYVYSDTSYLYTMDDDFNIIAEPTKVYEYNSYYSHYAYLTLTKYGVVGQMNGVIGFLDENLEFTEKIVSIDDVGEVRDDKNENSIEAEYLYISNDSGYCNYVYDLKNMEFVEFWKDENANKIDLDY